MNNQKSNPICGECKSPMVLRRTTKFSNPDGTPRLFFGCSNYPQCKGTHGAHQDTGEPLGIPADAETKKARMRAHDLFDQLWKKGWMTRNQAYEHMQELMKMSEEDAHISKFTKEQCNTLISKLIKRWGQKLSS